jgi:hypothetical protein
VFVSLQDFPDIIYGFFERRDVAMQFDLLFSRIVSRQGKLQPPIGREFQGPFVKQVLEIFGATF